MKIRLLTVLAGLTLGILGGYAPALLGQAPATPVPLITATPAPSARTLADKQAATAARITQQIKLAAEQLQRSNAAIDREINHNPDGLTPTQAAAALGDKAASLAQARAELAAVLAKYTAAPAPGGQ